MALTQIELSDDEARRLDELAARCGKTREEIAHEAVVDLLSGSERDDRLVRMRTARGLWSDRDDLPDLRTLRSEWDREVGRTADG